MCRQRIALLSLFFTIALARPAIAAPCDQEDSLDDWLQCRVQELQKKNLNQSALEKQVEQPSLSSVSPSLLDRTSAPDIMGMAFELFSAGDNQDIGGGSPSLTASAYALVSAARGLNPLDPAVYSAGRNWRRFSFTLGHEKPSSNENQEESRVVGGKFLIVNYRDVSSQHAQNLLDDASETLGKTNRLYNALSLAVRRFLYERLGPKIDPSKYPANGTPVQRTEFGNTELDSAKLQQTVALLTQAESDELDRMARELVVEAFEDEANQVRDIVSRIRMAPQFAISYTGKLRDRSLSDFQINEHRFEATFDYGVLKQASLSVNASYEYRDIKAVGADRRGGRVAAEMQFELNHDQALAKGITPYTFSLAFEGKFLTNMDNVYRAQGKFVVPITPGISLPLSVTVANRTELIDESEVRGQFGVTFDVSKLLQAFALR